MKILRIPAYCYPELVSSTHLENDKYEAYAKAGYEVEIYTPTPTRGIDENTHSQYKQIKYEELYDGHIKIHRFAMFREGRNPLARAVRYVLINVVQYFKSIRAKDIDIIYGGSTPPTQGVLCGWIKKTLSRKYRHSVSFVYNLQDVFPDSLVTTGITKEGSLIWRIGRRIEDYTYKSADTIIVISESMKRNIMAKGVPEDKIVVVSNWIDTDAVKPVAKEENGLFAEFGIDREKYTVLYAGNFGAAQGAEVVLEAAKLLPDVQFVIFGGGAGFGKAKENAEQQTNVIINGLLPQERIPEVYSLADVALITCKTGVGNSGMPSKTWSIMACGTPIVAAFDTESELAEIIAQANAGICVKPEDPVVLAQAINDMQIESGQYKGGRAFVCENASKTVCVNKYVEILRREAKNEASINIC